MKNFLLIIFIFLFAESTFGQDDYKKAHEAFTDRNTVVKLDLILPAIGIETRISDCTTLLFLYQPGFVSFQANNEPSQFYVINQFRGSIRFFYNIDRRNARGKKTGKFSGNFVSLYALYGSPSPVTLRYVTLGPTWGLQRNWGGIIHFSIDVGFGYTFVNSNTSFTIIGDLKLGFAL